MTVDLSALIARLEAAEVGSRELDAAVCDVLLEPIVTGLTKQVRPRWPFSEGSGIASKTPFVTTSLDAALALAERVLPGFYGQVYFDGADCCAYVGQSGLASELREKQGTAKTPALALCIAILRAKQGERAA